MIDQRHAKQTYQRIGAIEALNGDWDCSKALLRAAVWAMADEFADLSFRQLRETEPKNLPFFYDCVRHYWAHNGDEERTPCSLTSAAIRCPYTDQEILCIVQSFDDKHCLWEASTPAEVTHAG